MNWHRISSIWLLQDYIHWITRKDERLMKSGIGFTSCWEKDLGWAGRLCHLLELVHRPFSWTLVRWQIGCEYWSRYGQWDAQVSQLCCILQHCDFANTIFYLTLLELQIISRVFLITKVTTQNHIHNFV